MPALSRGHGAAVHLRLSASGGRRNRLFSASVDCGRNAAGGLFKQRTLRIRVSHRGKRELAKGTEFFSYGLLTCLSGGLDSPYLWYYISCLFMMLSLRQDFLFTDLGILWCLLCVVAEHLVGVQGTAVGHSRFTI